MLVEKIKQHFGSKYTYTQGPVYMAVKIPGKFSNSPDIEHYKVDMNIAHYYDCYGKLNEYLEGLNNITGK